MMKQRSLYQGVELDERSASQRICDFVEDVLKLHVQAIMRGGNRFNQEECANYQGLISKLPENVSREELVVAFESIGGFFSKVLDGYSAQQDDGRVNENRGHHGNRDISSARYGC